MAYIAPMFSMKFNIYEGLKIYDMERAYFPPLYHQIEPEPQGNNEQGEGQGSVGSDQGIVVAVNDNLGL